MVMVVLKMSGEDGTILKVKVAPKTLWKPDVSVETSCYGFFWGEVINTIAGNQNCNDYYYDSGWYDEDDEDQH